MEADAELIAEYDDLYHAYLHVWGATGGAMQAIAVQIAVERLLEISRQLESRRYVRCYRISCPEHHPRWYREDDHA